LLIEQKIADARLWTESLRLHTTHLGDRTQLADRLDETLEELNVALEELTEQREELIESQLAVEAERRHYKDLFDSAPSPFFITDGFGVIGEANRAAAEMLGISAQDLAGKSLIMYVTNRKPFLAALQRLKKEPEARGIEIHLHGRGSDRSLVECEADIVSEPDANGGARRLRWILHDVSDQRRIAATIQRNLRLEQETAARLRDLGEMKDSFLAAVSHELRTPLTVLIGVAETLQSHVEIEPEDRADLVGRLVDRAHGLDGLLQDLLDLQRLKTLSLEAVRRPTDLQALAQEIVRETPHNSREIHLDAQRIVADVEGATVGRILSNLITNAVKHSPEHGKIWVHIAAEKRTGVTLSVADQGPGVPERSKERIFGMFERSGELTDPTPGLGIGLSLVAGFVAMHGGRVWVEKRRGGGASFRVFLPAAVRSVDSLETTSS